MDRDALHRRLLATFLVELEEHVAALERDLLAWEGGVEQSPLLATLFRSAHSLKGAALAVDAALIARVCHHMEGILAAARDGAELGSETVQLLLVAADGLREAGARMAAGQPLHGASLEDILPRLEAAASHAPRVGSAGEAGVAPVRQAGRAVRLPVTGRPPRATTGSAQATPLLSSAPVEASPSAPGASVPAASLAPGEPDPAASAALDEPPDPLVRVPASKLDQLQASSTELLVARGRQAAQQQGLDEVRDLVRALRTQRAGDRAESPQGPGSLGTGDGRRALSRLEGAIDKLEATLRSDQQALVRAASRLEDQVRRVRMQPLAVACEGLARVVRDTARAVGKDVALVVRGGEVELDRAVLEGLRDPLAHLVRNAVVHGVEPPEQRERLGKPRATVTVGARLRGDHVDIDVTDDGAGLDLAGIQARAATLGLPVPADHGEAARAVLISGFSTATAVTELSGRGVGLDVVRDRVEVLRGTVELHSVAGEGLRVRLTVPLTLATVRALLVRTGEHTVAVPVASVERLVRLGPDDLRTVAGRTVAAVLGEAVPVASLGRILGGPGGATDGRPSGPVAPRSPPGCAAGRAPAMPDAPPAGVAQPRWPAVVLVAGDRRLAVRLTEAIAVHEVVVRSLGPRLRGLRFYAGATVLPTGRVAPILSAPDVIAQGLALPPLQEAPPAPRRRILVADDSATTRGLLRGILEAAGFVVQTAADGAEAWQRLPDFRADLVVADVEMPRADGVELTRRIRESESLRATPVVLVTALDSDEARARGLAAGADAYLVKRTFDQRELLATIAQLL